MRVCAQHRQDYLLRSGIFRAALTLASSTDGLHARLSGQGAGQRIWQQKLSCCLAMPGLWKWKGCPKVTLQTTCSGPFLERSPVDGADFSLEVKIHHASRFSGRFWLSRSGREGICVCARAVLAALRGWRGDLGRSLWVTGSIPFQILPLRKGCSLPGCQPPAEAKISSDAFHGGTKQTMGRVSKTAWGENGDCLDPHDLP